MTQISDGIVHIIATVKEMKSKKIIIFFARKLFLLTAIFIYVFKNGKNMKYSALEILYHIALKKHLIQSYGERIDVKFNHSEFLASN
jgi:hypothetical protein